MRSNVVMLQNHWAAPTVLATDPSSWLGNYLTSNVQRTTEAFTSRQEGITGLHRVISIGQLLFTELSESQHNGGEDETDDADVQCVARQSDLPMEVHCKKAVCEGISGRISGHVYSSGELV